MRIAAAASRHDAAGPSVDELLERTCSRRRFLRDSALVGAAVTFGAFGCRREPVPATSQTQAAPQWLRE